MQSTKKESITILNINQSSKVKFEFGYKTDNSELDITVFMLDKENKIENEKNIIRFNNLKSTEEDSSRNLTIDFNHISDKVEKIHSYVSTNKKSLSRIKELYVKVFNENDEQIVEYIIDTKKFDKDFVFLFELYKRRKEWILDMKEIQVDENVETIVDKYTEYIPTPKEPVFVDEITDTEIEEKPKKSLFIASIILLLLVGSYTAIQNNKTSQDVVVGEATESLQTYEQDTNEEESNNSDLSLNEETLDENDVQDDEGNLQVENNNIDTNTQTENNSIEVNTQVSTNESTQNNSVEVNTQTSTNENTQTNQSTATNNYDVQEVVSVVSSSFKTYDEAIKTGDLSAMTESVNPNGKAFKEYANYIPTLKEKGITVDYQSHQILSQEKNNNDEWEVEYIVTSLVNDNGQERVQKEQIKSVLVDINGKLLVDEIIEFKILDKMYLD